MPNTKGHHRGCPFVFGIFHSPPSTYTEHATTSCRCSCVFDNFIHLPNTKPHLHWCVFVFSVFLRPPTHAELEFIFGATRRALPFHFRHDEKVSPPRHIVLSFSRQRGVSSSSLCCSLLFKTDEELSSSCRLFIYIIIYYFRHTPWFKPVRVSIPAGPSRTRSRQCGIPVPVVTGRDFGGDGWGAAKNTPRDTWVQH